jgi:hypothetical protein
MRRTVISKGEQIEILRVPFCFQGERDTLCVPFALMMSTQYFANIYNDSYVRETTPNLGIEDILKITKTRILGTIVDEELMRRLNGAFPSLKFELAKGYSMEALIKRFGKNLPTIALYDLSYLLTEIPGALHAGVVVGFIYNDYIVLNNPFLGPLRPVDMMSFRRSWEVEGNLAILVDPVKQRKLEDLYDRNSK